MRTFPLACNNVFWDYFFTNSNKTKQKKGEITWNGSRSEWVLLKRSSLHLFRIVLWQIWGHYFIWVYICFNILKNCTVKWMKCQAPVYSFHKFKNVILFELHCARHVEWNDLRSWISTFWKAIRWMFHNSSLQNIILPDPSANRVNYKYASD